MAIHHCGITLNLLLGGIQISSKLLQPPADLYQENDRRPVRGGVNWRCTMILWLDLHQGQRQAEQPKYRTSWTLGIFGIG